MNKRILFCALMVLFSFAAFAQGQGHADLRWAKSLMDRGDYAYAAEKFGDIARSQYNSPEVKKEAFYYLGYCHVKNNDPWEAVRVFERFLEKYDDGISREFIPDALYVLGRVYEETGDRRAAIRVYQRCRKNYPNNSFGRKSSERLRELGFGGGSGNTDPFDDNNGGNSGGDDYTGGGDYNDGHDNHGGHDHHGPATGISREIRQLLRVAETVSNSFTRDQMLLEGSSRARTGEDMVALAKAIENDFTRGQLVSKVASHPKFSEFAPKSMIEMAGFINNSFTRDQFLVDLGKNMANRDYVSNYEFVDVSAAMENDMLRQQLFNAIAAGSVFKVMSARTIVDLAKTCGNAFISDQFLLTAAKDCPLSYRECMVLAEAADNAFTQNQIIQLAKNKEFGSSHHGHHRAVEKPARVPEIIIDVTDPFTGFDFNRAQLLRVSNFVKAVEKKRAMKSAFAALKKSDMSLATVREYVEKYQALENFNNVHRQR
ncbi:MAG: tetratricopeptide repeat protein [Candidatus Riflebacteria bacterium]